MTPAERRCVGCGRQVLTVVICGYVTTYTPSARILGQVGWWHGPCLVIAA